MNMSVQETPVGDNQNDSNNNSKNDNQNSTSEVGEDRICRDYQRGVCNRRGKCKFRHPDGMGTEIANQPMICRDFQNGKCGRSTCKYAHMTNSEEKVFLHTGQMPPQGGGGARPMFARGHGRGPRGETTRAGPQDPICKDYLNQKCTRGTGCKFRHVMEEDTGFGGDGGYGYEDYPRKRRRESHEAPDHYLMEENESLRRKVADLQKQVGILKAANEVLLDQNAHYRNQAGGASSSHDSYNSGNQTSQRSAEPTSSNSYTANYSNSSSTQSYSTTYPPRDSYYSGNSYSAQGGGSSGAQYSPASKDAYNASKDTYNSSNYTSNSAYGSSGYTKFE